MSAGTSSISTIFTGAGSSSMTKSAAASWLAGSAEASSMRSRSGDPGVGVRSGSTAGTTGGSEASPRSCATRSASGTSMAKVSGSRSTGATEAVASGGIAPAPAVGAISTAVRPSSQPGGLNGAGNSSSPGISTGPRAMDAANTSRESWRTISSRGKSSRPLTIRAATSDKGTAKTSGGNWPATTSHSTCTTPSPSWGTMRACGTTSISRSASWAPTWCKGSRKAPGGSCPITRSKGMRIALPTSVGRAVTGSVGSTDGSTASGSSSVSAASAGRESSSVARSPKSSLRA